MDNDKYKEILDVILAEPMNRWTAEGTIDIKGVTVRFESSHGNNSPFFVVNGVEIRDGDGRISAFKFRRHEYLRSMENAVEEAKLEETYNKLTGK